MLTQLMQFLHMGGYGFYVWSAYLMVFFLLTIHWFLAWQSLKHQGNKNKNVNKANSHHYFYESGP